MDPAVSPTPFWFPVGKNAFPLNQGSKGMLGSSVDTAAPTDAEFSLRIAGMNCLPLLTIATVCRNPGSALAATVESLRPIKLPWVRYIVIDGASNDGTAEALRDGLYCVDEYLSEPDAGIYDAMNKAVKLAPA